MYLKEKRILISLISLILILGFYSLFVYHKFIAVNLEIINDFKFWGMAFLILIPVTIGVQIIILIVFFIINKILTNEEINTITDERDNLIELKAIRISHWIFTFGFLLSMVSQVIGMRPWVMFITLVCSGFISSIVSGIAKIYFYRKGF
jgi:hypothetical protein